MTVQEAKDRYISRFGGFPEFLFMGAEDAVIINAVKTALDRGKEIELPDTDADY